MDVGTFTLSGMVDRGAADRRTRWLFGNSSGRRGVSRTADHGSSASARSVDAVGRRVAGSADRPDKSSRSPAVLSGEAALGPVAFMHRASSAENPTAPLSHHIFDSTHIVDRRRARPRRSRTGVGRRARSFAAASRTKIATTSISARSTRGRRACGCDRQPRGRYRRRTDFCTSPSCSSRAISSGPTRPRRGFGSARSDYSAVTAAVGWNARPFSTVHAVLVEGTHHFRPHVVLRTLRRHDRGDGDSAVSRRSSTGRIPASSWIRSTRSRREPFATSPRSRGLSLGVGGDVTFYQLPPLLQITHERASRCRSTSSCASRARRRTIACGTRRWPDTAQGMMGMAHHHRSEAATSIGRTEVSSYFRRGRALRRSSCVRGRRRTRTARSANRLRAFGIGGHREEELLKRRRPFDPGADVTIVAEQDDGRRDWTPVARADAAP